MIIKGNTVGTTMPRANWNQTDPAKADYIIGKETVDDGIRAAQEAADYAQSAADDAQATADDAMSAANDAQSAAEDAQATADDALSAAEDAQTTADEAKTAAGNAQIKHVAIAVTLSAANWSNLTQTVAVEGVTASNTVIVTPAPASHIDYCGAGVYCSAQASGTLTFNCTENPAVDMAVNVMILN